MNCMKKVVILLETLLAKAFELFWRFCYYTSLANQHKVNNNLKDEDKH